MANVNPADFVDGNVVNFRDKDTLDRYEGKVCYFEPETSRFGIEGGDERLYIGGAYINRLQYIEIGDNPGGVNQAEGNNQAGQNGTNGTSAHASVNQAAGSSSTNAHAGQNGNGA